MLTGILRAQKERKNRFCNLGVITQLKEKGKNKRAYTELILGTHKYKGEGRIVI